MRITPIIGVALSILFSVSIVSAADMIVYTNTLCGQPSVARVAVGQLQMIDTTMTQAACMNSISPRATHTGGLNMFNDGNSPKKNPIILLDLAQKDIIGYRTALLRAEQIRYANAIRSLRIRESRSKTSDTTGYLIKNAAVKVTGTATGWSPVRSGKVVITDTRENTIDIDTTHGVSGYVATHYLRDATPADLIQIGQADIAYWSDITHTRVAHLVNIRLHPWYGSHVVRTVSYDVPLYRVATIDNWSEVESMDGQVHGFIRSDYLVVDQTQLIETKPLLY